MRLWSIHPKYLDRQGLLAGWREALLAQRVLAGGTTGYRSHPQLLRFSTAPAECGGSRALIEAYLVGIANEAERRGYRFNRGRIGQDWPDQLSIPPVPDGQLSVTNGQCEFESRHLAAKLKNRSPEWWQQWANDPQFGTQSHPLFTIIPGPVADWERAERQ